MFSSQQGYRLFHLQKTRYLALKALGQWCSSVRWKASVCTLSRQNTPKTEWLGGSLVRWVTEKAPSDFWPSMCCSNLMLKGWAEGPVISCTEWHQKLPFTHCVGRCQETADLKTLYLENVLLRLLSLTCGTLCFPLWSLADQAHDKKRLFHSKTGKAIPDYLNRSPEW